MKYLCFFGKDVLKHILRYPSKEPTKSQGTETSDFRKIISPPKVLSKTSHQAFKTTLITNQSRVQKNRLEDTLVMVKKHILHGQALSRSTISQRDEPEWNLWHVIVGALLAMKFSDPLEWSNT